MAWNKEAETTVPLPAGMKPRDIAKIDLYGAGEVEGVPVRRRMYSFLTSVEQTSKTTINEKGESVPVAKKRIVVAGGVKFTADGVVFPALGWPPEMWNMVAVVATDKDGVETELAALDV